MSSEEIARTKGNSAQLGGRAVSIPVPMPPTHMFAKHNFVSFVYAFREFWFESLNLSQHPLSYDQQALSFLVCETLHQLFSPSYSSLFPIYALIYYVAFLRSLLLSLTIHSFTPFLSISFLNFLHSKISSYDSC